MTTSTPVTTSIPVTTLSNLRKNLVPPSLLDLLYIQQGSEHDRDSAISLGQLFNSQVFQSFLNNREDWRTFTADAENKIYLGDYNKNIIIVPSKKDQSVTLDHFPSNGLIIYAPDWDKDSASTAVTIGDSYGAIPIIKGGIGVFYSLGSSKTVIGRSLLGFGSDSIAQLKELFLNNLKVRDYIQIKYGNASNDAYSFQTSSRVVGGSTVYDLNIKKLGDPRTIRINGDTLKVDFLGINPGFIDFDDGQKNFWGNLGSDNFKTLKAEAGDINALEANSIDADFIAAKRRVYKDVDISNIISDIDGYYPPSYQTQYEQNLGRSTSFYLLGAATAIFTFDKTTCEVGEEVLLFTPADLYIRYNKDDKGDYTSRQIQANSLLKMVYLGLNTFGNPYWTPL